MADWLAEAKNGSRGIVMEVFTGNNKSVTTVRKQLEAGMDYLNSRGVKNVAPMSWSRVRKLLRESGKNSEE